MVPGKTLAEEVESRQLFIHSGIESLKSWFQQPLPPPPHASPIIQQHFLSTHGVHAPCKTLGGRELLNRDDCSFEDLCHQSEWQEPSTMQQRSNMMR